MAPAETILNKLKDVPKGSKLKIIYDGGSNPGSTRYALFDSMCIPGPESNPDGYVNIIDNNIYKSLYVKKIFIVDVIDTNVQNTFKTLYVNPIEIKFNLKLEKNMRIRFHIKNI